MSIVIDMCKI